MSITFTPTPPPWVAHFIPTRTPTPFISPLAYPAAPSAVTLQAATHDDAVWLIAVLVWLAGFVAFYWWERRKHVDR